MLSFRITYISFFVYYIKDALISIIIFYKGVDVMNSCQLTASITALANVITCRLNIEEITLLAALFVQLGDTLATIATQKSICEGKES